MGHTDMNRTGHHQQQALNVKESTCSMSTKRRDSSLTCKLNVDVPVGRQFDANHHAAQQTPHTLTSHQLTEPNALVCAWCCCQQCNA